MNIYNLPTGYLFTDDYSKGKLETLSIADYGKHRNIKAQFLGFNKEINGVDNGNPLPVSEKWVITMSTQFGCPMKCKFCDVPNYGFHGNAIFEDFQKQFYSALKMFPNTKYTDRLNVHFARMGEPSFNRNVINFAGWMYKHKMDIFNNTGVRLEVIHPVVSTMLPKSAKIWDFVHSWCCVKNDIYNGQAGLQFSVNSTDDAQRDDMFAGMSNSLEEISKLGKSLPVPLGRKYCLNFCIADDTIIDAEKLATLFDSEKFMVKLTPIHKTTASVDNGIKTTEGYSNYTPYQQHEANLIKAGFDVIVFVPSQEEEDSLITCGNAVLGGSTFKGEG